MPILPEVGKRIAVGIGTGGYLPEIHGDRQGEVLRSGDNAVGAGVAPGMARILNGQPRSWRHALVRPRIPGMSEGAAAGRVPRGSEGAGG